MINGEQTREAPSEVTSPDPYSSFPSLRVRQSDEADASLPSSRYSSCGDSEFDRYCSANSAMGTPSMSSAITVFNDFPDFEFGSVKSFGLGDDNALEDFSLGGKIEIIHKDRKLSTSGVSDSMRDFRTGFRSDNVQNQKNLVYGSSGLELYGDENDELTMTVLDGSGLTGDNQFNKDSGQNLVLKDVVEGSFLHKELGGSRNDFENLSRDGSDNAGNTEGHLLGSMHGKCSQSVPTVGEGGSSSAVAGEDEFNRFDTQSNLQIGERETEREEYGNSFDCQHLEGEDSMYNYGGDDNKTVFYMPRSIHCPEESKAQHENPLLINTSIAFVSKDLDDFLLESEGSNQVSHMVHVLGNQEKKNSDIEETPRHLSSVAATVFPSAGQKEEGKDPKDVVIVSGKFEIKDPNELEKLKEVRDNSAACRQVQVADELTSTTRSSSNSTTGLPKIVNTQQEDSKEIYVDKNQIEGADKIFSCPKMFPFSKAHEVDLNPLAEETHQHMGLDITDGGTMEKEHQPMSTKETIGASDAQRIGSLDSDNSKLNIALHSDGKLGQNCSLSTKHFGNRLEESFEHFDLDMPSSNFGMRKLLKSSPTSADLLERTPLTTKMENLELIEFYDEFVHEMEEILLDSIDSPAARLSHTNRLREPQSFISLRDGGSTASTSGTDDSYPLVQRPLRIDRIEVVGARQKRGDVSFSERLVGVKEYTVYKIRVWSGKDEWEVERRYRDFFTLYRRLKALFTEKGWVLPLPWSSVEKESKNIFGSASPDVILERSILIQECLQSILRTRFFSSPPSALIWFLSPQDSYPGSPQSNALVSQSSFFTGGENSRSFSALGKTISLIVDIQPHKSIKQMLEAQHYTCAGCHKYFDEGKTFIQDFVQTFGWGTPRLCEYTGQLFCSTCHTNETAVLPARVLHHWDFTQYPVSQLAKSYLDSIHDQPMLCVTAVNPLLLSKVPALLHVMNVRKKIGTMLPFVQCPFRRSINRGLGSRKYLLESNDFFALRDLIDLSKGAFAALPVMVETVSRKILEHITDQCLICCDVGVPCSARQDCNDPSSLIFPFQEDEIQRCSNCQSVFHKSCIKKLVNCSCGTRFRPDELMGLTSRLRLRPDESMGITNRASQRGSGETGGTLDSLGRGLSSGLSTGFLTGLFSKEQPDKSDDRKDENVILMGSLPSTSL